MIYQDNHGYQKVLAQYVKGKTPICNIYRKEYYDAMMEDNKRGLAFLGDPIIEKWEPSLLEALKRLRHHDEYFAIINLKTMKVEWCFGLGEALGYEDEEIEWSIKNQHFIVHHKYYPIFMALGLLMNSVMKNLDLHLKPLGHRYTINIPLKKKNGSYVWVKQLSTPLSIDADNRMVRQLNSYTVICGYKGITLPFLPRLFNPDGARALNVEKALFTTIVEKSQFTISPTQKRVAQSAIVLWDKKMDEGNDEEFDNQPILVSHNEIADYMRSNWGKIHHSIKHGTIRIHVDNIKKRVENSFGFRFPGIVEMAIFLKKMYCLEDE